MFIEREENINLDLLKRIGFRHARFLVETETDVRHFLSFLRTGYLPNKEDPSKNNGKEYRHLQID